MSLIQRNWLFACGLILVLSLTPPVAGQERQKVSVAFWGEDARAIWQETKAALESELLYCPQQKVDSDVTESELARRIHRHGSETR